MSDIYAHNAQTSLKKLVEQVNSGELVLPQFQRSFVWDPRDIKSLIVSVVRNYPAGSILQVGYSQKHFEVRYFENVINPSQQATYMILDGQQRLTSLHNAFYGAGKHLFYVKVQSLLDGNDIDDSVFTKTKSQKTEKQMNDRVTQVNTLELPISLFIDSGELSKWIEVAAETYAKKQFNDPSISKDMYLLVKENRHRLEKVLIPINKAIEKYHFPVLSLAKDSTAEAICIIFETLNNTGVKLRVFDLLNARFFPNGINLRLLWDNAKRAYPILDEFRVDPYQLLQSISALTSKSASVTRKSVLDLNLDRRTFETYWDGVCKSMADVLSMLQTQCGVLSHKWLPYSTILVTLATVVHEFPIDKVVESATRIKIIEKWFWLSCFGQRYQQSSNAQISSDIPKLREWIKTGKSYLELDENDISEDVIRATTRSQSAVYRAIMCTIVSSGSKDFYTGKPINSSVLIEQKIDDHHIFPSAFLKKHYFGQDQIDCIGNRTLIDATTNKSIGDHPPSRYLAKIQNAQGDSISSDTFQSHLVNDEAMDAMKEDNFEEFCNARIKLIRERVRKLMV